MAPQDIALIVSIASAVIASLSLGWNIYRDVVLKAKVSVSFAVVTIIHQSMPERPRYLNISATNFGPGPVNISIICVKEAQFWRRILQKVKWAVINPDYTNPMSARLPAKIEVGDKIELLLPYEKECFLHTPFTHVGVSDYFGRKHWAPSSQVRAAYKSYREDFQSET